MQDAACDVVVNCLPDGTVELLRSTRAPQDLEQAHRLIADHTALYISFKPPDLPPSVFIVNHGVNGHIFELEPHKTVGDLQACCADIFNVPIDSQARSVWLSRLAPHLTPSTPHPLTPSPPHPITPLPSPHHPSLQALLARGLRVDDQGGAERTLDQLHQLLRTRSGTVELIDLRDPKQEVLQASSWAGANRGQQITVTIKTLTGQSIPLEFLPLDTVRAGVVGLGLGLGLGLEQALGV